MAVSEWHDIWSLWTLSAQESEDRESGAVTSLLGDTGMVTTEINTLQMPGT